ncbi:MAG: anhydro-N-acetylmuramic acid kinase [Acidobacteriota bacterium]|nr:anhydro-N-acetylmuramic acid kinase [Acidobacteriota bacterium]
MNVIGMISGTSFDAIEAVALRITLRDRVAHAELVEHVSVPYEEDLRSRVALVLPPNATTIEEVCQLDTLIGLAFADVAASLARRCFADDVDVVCSHGQTVYHWVVDGHACGTLQIGQGAWIAEATGATVVSDVRSRDVAAGGHGAPLASLVDVLLLGRRPDVVRGALNLGGIANVTVVGPALEPLAFDIGPANALMDAAITWVSDGAAGFDEGGASAARGAVDEALLEALLDDPYYRAPAPKSTGKELFNLSYLRERIGSRSIDHDDLLATLCELTARTVADAVLEQGVVELFVSGGGTRNPTLMAAMSRHLKAHGVTIALIDDFGVPEAAKEALLFALIGFLSVQGLAGSIASCTGAAHASVLGSIIPGRQPVSSLAATQAPERLVVRSTPSAVAS